MRKLGFTLAEVLITLMIIGVVATLTTPALVKNVGSSKIGPQLSKFVNTFETAVETMMMEESISTMTASSGETFGDSGLRKLSKYMIMTNMKNAKINGGSILEIKSSSGARNIRSFDLTAGHIWQLKDGTIIVFEQFPSHIAANADYTATDSYKGCVGGLAVDIGGTKGSHRAGKEVFLFLIDDNGTLVPYGSNAHRAMNSNFKKDLTCAMEYTNDAAFACTGAAADNGWKATW